MCTQNIIVTNYIIFASKGLSAIIKKLHYYLCLSVMLMPSGRGKILSK